MNMPNINLSKESVIAAGKQAVDYVKKERSFVTAGVALFFSVIALIKSRGKKD